jgi:hypothetical protein
MRGADRGRGVGRRGPLDLDPGPRLAGIGRTAMANWQLLSKHEYQFISAFPDFVRAFCTVAVGLGLVVGGVALIVYGGHFTPYVLGTVFALLGLPTVAVGVILWPWRQASWVRVYEEGLRWKVWGRVYKKRWEEVTFINQFDINEIHIDGSRSDWGSSSTLGLRFDDGTHVIFSTALSNYGRLGRVAREQVAARKQAPE